MDGAVERYRPRAVARQHARDVDTVRREFELAEARVLGTAELTREAILEHVMTSMTVEWASHAAPSGSNGYGALAAGGVAAMGQKIMQFGTGR